MQVTNVNPTSKGDTSRPSHIKTFPNVFALGDVCLTIADEEKSVLPINFMAKELAHNIRVLSESADKPDEPLRAIPDTIHRVYFVPFGFNDGIGVWNEFVVRGKIGPWMKDFITSIWMATTHNSKVAVMSYDFMYWNMGIMFKIFDSRLTSWLPCSSRRIRREDVRATIKQKVLKQA